MGPEVQDYSIDQWRQLINEANSSELSKREWCAKVGISEKQFYYWQSKIRKIDSQLLTPEESEQTVPEESEQTVSEESVQVVTEERHRWWLRSNLPLWKSQSAILHRGPLPKLSGLFLRHQPGTVWKTRLRPATE